MCIFFTKMNLNYSDSFKRAPNIYNDPLFYPMMIDEELQKFKFRLS